jgi:hypothetical protein
MNQPRLEVNLDIAVLNAERQTETVQYPLLSSLLLNELQKQQMAKPVSPANRLVAVNSGN